MGCTVLETNEMRNLAILLAASAASMVAVPAFAATIITTLPPIVVPPTQTLAPSVTFGTNGDNTGLYEFTVSQNNTQVNASFINSPDGSTGAFNFSSINLYSGTGTTGTVLESGTVQNNAGFDLASITPYTLNIGSYTVGYQGTVTGAPASVGSSFTFAAGAVPEASTWAMMVVGFGMMGFGLRRRKSSVKTTVSFA